ncbi:MAG: M23 family metallopeptidase [Vicingaceae bacterium]|nr:M23 family metallopeptidase [Vicingaceae bacterium]
MKNIIALLFISISLVSFAQKEEKLFDVYNVRNQEDGSAVVYATNNYICDESVLITFNTLKNMEADVKLPFKGVIPAGAKEYKLFTLTIKDRTKESGLGYITKYCHGDIFEGKHDDSYVYTIPYKEGEQYGIGQAYGGKFSHFMEGKTHAIDFTMDVGTPICAARDGIILEVKEDSDKRGKTYRYEEYGNFIVIYHSDGTMANYFHIKKNGSKVKVGDRVEAGQVIALSGNTGWSSGPHLHFQVYGFDKDMEVKSVPTKFRQEEGKAITLQKSKEGYKSVH